MRFFTMLIAVIEEIWPWPVRPDSTPKVIGPVDAGDGYDAARRLAETRAKKFERHEYNREFDYWWGRNEGATEYHRFCVR
jgi:hypothetical protein